MNGFYEYDLGLTDYRDVLALQHKLTEARQRKDIADILLLTEHNPVVTIGRFMKSDELETEMTVTQEKILELGISVIPCDRGGRLTYHGPGQLVAYPIIHLQENRLSVKQYVWMLEESIIETLSQFGIHGKRLGGLTGVWVGENKVAALGLHVSDGVSRHGLALNVDIDLHPFGLIIPCGITKMGVTSVADIVAGIKVSMTAVKNAFIESITRVFNMDVRLSGGMSECMSMVESSLNGSGRVH